MNSFGNSKFPVVLEPITRSTLYRQCIILPQGVASSYIFIHNGHLQMVEKAKNYTVGVPAAWQRRARHHTHSSSAVYWRTSELTSQFKFVSSSFQRNNSIIMTVNGRFQLIGTMRETGLNIRSK